MNTFSGHKYNISSLFSFGLTTKEWGVLLIAAATNQLVAIELQSDLFDEDEIRIYGIYSETLEWVKSYDANGGSWLYDPYDPR